MLGPCIVVQLCNHLRNYFIFLNAHGIMNTLDLFQSK